MYQKNNRWRKFKGKRTRRNLHLSSAREKREAAATSEDPKSAEANARSQTPTGRTGTKFARFSVSQEVDDNEYFLICRAALQSAVKGLQCKFCKQECLAVEITNRKGFAFTMVVVCQTCEMIQSKSASSPRIVSKDSTRPPYDVNRKLVEAFVRNGSGYNAMLKFGTIVGVEVLDQSSYRDHMVKLVEENTALKGEILSQARSAVRHYYEEKDPSLKSEEVIDVIVSFDGSWHRRGRCSNYGIVGVIEVNTGLVIDFETFSKYCHICSVAEAELGKNTLEFKEWHEKHLEMDECSINFSGASGNMESEGAVVIWKRSEKEAKMRYTKFVSDGDAKSFSAIQKAQPYGPDVQIEKDECINHIGKRLGTALRNLVSDYSKRKITLGKKPGALTQVKIDKLQGYHQKAIIENSDDIGKMTAAVLAPVHHYASTDQKPMHQYCSQGSDSWCFYQKAKAANKRSKPSHQEMKTIINKQVFHAVLPVYKRLSDPELLNRCKSSLTQNANESLHNVIWSKVPKTTFVGKGRLDLGVTQAIGEFNMGCSTLMAINAEVTERPNSAQSMRNAEKIDRKRLALSNKQADLETKKKRARKKKQKKNKGPDHYAPGGGD